MIEEEGLQANAKRVGDVFLKGMMELRDEFEIVGDVRGKGLMLGMELVEDKVRAWMGPALPNLQGVWLMNYTHLLHPEKLLCVDLCFSSVQQETPPTRENGHLV